MADDSMTVLEWTYEPADLFEEPVVFTWSGGEVRIEGGRVRGTFDPEYYTQGREFRDAAHEIVLGRFQAQQIQTQTLFDLSPASMSREHGDGRRDVTAFMETAKVSLTGHPVDIVLRDAEGNVVEDTKATRTIKHRRFGESVIDLLTTDPTLKKIMNSFDKALRDKGNLLVHLYEIRDAISKEYGSEKNARNSVKVTGADWSKFGRMVNDDPLLEGRHRGKHTGLRNCTKDEISFATGFAQALIEGYVVDKTSKVNQSN
jgi:hypothetical protein